MFDIEKSLIFNGEEMPMQDVAQTAEAMAEAPCGCGFTVPVVLSSLSSREIILLLGLARQSISSFQYDTCFFRFCSIDRPKPAEWN